MLADRENFYGYCVNTHVDLDALPVSRARLTVVEPALFELDMFEFAAPIQSAASLFYHCQTSTAHRSTAVLPQ